MDLKLGGNAEYEVSGYRKDGFVHISTHGWGEVDSPWGGFAGFTISGTSVSQIAPDITPPPNVTDYQLRNRVRTKIYGVAGKDNIVSATFDFKQSSWSSLNTWNYSEGGAAIVFYIEFSVGNDYEYKLNGSTVEGTFWSGVTIK